MTTILHGVKAIILETNKIVSRFVVGQISPDFAIFLQRVLIFKEGSELS